MKAVSVKELKLELEDRSPKELRELCLRLSKFKKENKELLTYLLFESGDEASYVESVKKDIDQQFEERNRKSQYLIKKSLRKILRSTKKYIRYSLRKETEVELLLYYCSKLKTITPSIQRNTALLKLYIGLIATIKNKITALHEDLQSDYESELRELEI
jgi:hypothetical protein